MIDQLITVIAFTLPLAIIIVFFRSIAFWVHYIQIKQYRIDRLWVSVKTKSFWKLFFSKTRTLLILFFFLWQVFFRLLQGQLPEDIVLTSYKGLYILISVYFMLLAAEAVRKLLTKQLTLPVWTHKSIAIVGLILGLELFVSIPLFFYPEQMLLIELIQPFLVFFVFSILFIPNLFLHQSLKRKAIAKRKTYKDLTVIGITGSYGKSIMKEYLAFLLEKKFSVLKTPEHVNVDTGVAKLILDQLDEFHELFIVEMGAYKRGEIASLARIAQPTYAVMTGLGTQHLELFGSQENIETGKFELVDAVESDEYVFANKNSQKLEKAFDKRNMHPNWYGFSIDHLPTKERLTFAQKVTLDGAIKVAQKLGMHMNEIEERLKQGLPSIDGTMKFHQAKQGGLIIDDTYNASTEAVLAALSDLKGFNKPKKIFVFKEIIELGDQGREEHLRVANAAADSATHFVLFSGEYTSLMKETLLAHDIPEDRIIDASDDQRVLSLVDQQAVVLLEGRDANIFLSKLV